MKLSYIKYFLSLCLLMGLFSCQNTGQVDAVEGHHDDLGHHDKIILTQAQYDQAKITLGQVDTVIMAQELEVNGLIELPPQSNVSIGMPYGGFLKYTDMLPGTRVKKGQLLAVIENPDFIQFQQDYLIALANSDYLKANYERQEELYIGGVAAGKDFELAKSSYLANEAKISGLAERLKLIGFNLDKVQDGKMSAKVNIYAPVGGAVRDVYTNIGRYVQPQEVIMNLTNDDDLHVELTVYESEIHRVKKGQTILFTLVNQPDVVRKAVVFLVGSNVREDRSVTVHGHLAEHYDDILPGMYVRARLSGAERGTIAVPEEAVVRFDGKRYVFSYLGKEQSESLGLVHTFQMMEVKVAASQNGFLEMSLTEDGSEISQLMLVKKGAFTLLAKDKNSEEGHGH